MKGFLQFTLEMTLKECNADIAAPAAALYLSNKSLFPHPCNLPLVTLSMIHNLPNVQGEDPLHTKKDSKCQFVMVCLCCVLLAPDVLTIAFPNSALSYTIVSVYAPTIF